MNLIIDQGNTRAKIAIFKDQELCEMSELDCLDVKSLKEFIGSRVIKNCILSSVKTVGSDLCAYLKTSFFNFVHLNYKTPMPLRLGYATPETLGCDRIAAAAGASDAKAACPVIVIDAGTAITYDFMNAEGVFEGGDIAPGIHLRLKSLNEFTDRLPLIDKTGEVPLVGYNTETAIRSGVINGICYEIEGFIATIKATHPMVLVFLTGGDAIYLAEKIKYPIFVDKNLVLKGLNRILNYNVEQ